MLEPATPEEAKAMTRAAFALSEDLKVPVLLRTTTRVNHTRGAVTLGELAARPGPGRFHKDPFRQVMVPAVARQAHVRLLAAEDQARALAETSPFNEISGRGDLGRGHQRGGGTYVADALKELGLADKVRLLKLGFTHPLPEALLGDFLAPLSKVLVVEELEPYLEEALKAVAQTRGLTVTIRGKGPGLFSRLYEYHPALVREVIARFFGVASEAPEPMVPEAVLGQPLPDRPPNLCAGCPHRATYYAVKIALKDLGVEGVFPTDIGCYTLGLLPPLSMADFLICMGSSHQHRGGDFPGHGPEGGGLHRGFHLFPRRAAGPGQRRAPQARLSAGHPGQRHHGHDRTPAPPRGQPDAPGYPGEHVPIARVVKALGVEQLWVVNPFKYKESLAATKEALGAAGVRVLISQAPCHLYAQR